jgi:hypothetical protein
MPYFASMAKPQEMTGDVWNPDHAALKRRSAFARCAPYGAAPSSSSG